MKKIVSTKNTSEHEVMNQIRLWCGNHNWLCFRCNVGKVKTIDGIWFDTGLPKGFSDLLIFTDKNIPVFCEVKNATGKQREEQKAFEQMLRARKLLYILPHSLQEFIDCAVKLKLIES